VFTANQNNYFIIFKNEWCNFRGKLSLNTIKHKKKINEQDYDIT